MKLPNPITMLLAAVMLISGALFARHSMYEPATVVPTADAARQTEINWHDVFASQSDLAKLEGKIETLERAILPRRHPDTFNDHPDSEQTLVAWQQDEGGIKLDDFVQPDPEPAGTVVSSSWGPSTESGQAQRDSETWELAKKIVAQYQLAQCEANGTCYPSYSAVPTATSGIVSYSSLIEPLTSSTVWGQNYATNYPIVQSQVVYEPSQLYFGSYGYEYPNYVSTSTYRSDRRGLFANRPCRRFLCRLFGRR